MSQYSKKDLSKLTRKQLLQIIKSKGYDQNIDGTLQKNDGSLKKNLNSDVYVCLILDAQMNCNQDNNNNNEANKEEQKRNDAEHQNDDGRNHNHHDNDHPSCQTFDEWKDNYISFGLQNHGRGWCWQEREHGLCYDPHGCKYIHRVDVPRSQMRMQWGKHEGKLIHQLPPSYANWMKREFNFENRSPVFAREFRRVWRIIFDRDWNW